MQRSQCVRVRGRVGRLGWAACVLLGLAAALVSVPAGAMPASADAEAAATAVLDQVVDGLWERSDRFFHNGDYETASRINRLAVRLDPNFVEGINTLAWLLRQGLSRPKEALALHHRAVRDNPESWEAYFDLGMFHFDAKEYPLAAHYFRQSVERDAPAAKQHMLAHTYEKMDRRADALRTWRAIVEKFPGDLAARHNLQRLEKEE